MILETVPDDLSALGDEELLALTKDALNFAKQDRQEWQILYYKPNSPEALQIHLATEHLMGIGGGNRSGKTDTNLAEAVIQATGIIPESLKRTYPREKIRGPISVRVVCESITTTLAPVILHKLNYANWNGVDAQGGERGHWGWIPKCCLIDESWEKSWKESKRQLTVLCRDPDNPDIVLGHSVWQFMSHDQDPEKFASGEFHLVVIDEPPSLPVFTENCLRIASVRGRLMLGMTWPDDPTIPVDYLFDKLYDIGQPGPAKHPDVKWIELNTLHNPNIDQEGVKLASEGLNNMERAARIGGKPIRFSNLIHAGFTDIDAIWCFVCNQEVLAPEGLCTKCFSDDVVTYNHVQEFSVETRWPSLFLLDPHPRKPHMFLYVQVDGNDDYSVVFAGECEDEPLGLKQYLDEIEGDLGLMVAKKIMDPNMGASPASVKRGVTWQNEFSAVGLHCDLAIDSSVGRGRVDEYLKPDRQTRRPRLRFRDEECDRAVFQMKRFVWDDFKHKDNRDVKQVPKAKYDDYPALLRYLMNDMPLHSMLKHGGTVIRRPGMKGGY